MDDEIAEHAFAQGHWPGLTVTEIKAKIADVRTSFQEEFDFGNDRRIYRKGNTILIEDGKGSGTIFQPAARSASSYFIKFIDGELGGT